MALTKVSKKQLATLATLPIAAALALTACGEAQVEETAYTNSQEGVEMTLTLFHKGDEVVKQTSNSTIEYAAMGIENKEQAQEMLDPVVAESEGIDGYEHTIEYTDTAATEELSVDYEIIDMSELGELSSYESTGDMEDANSISLQETTEMLEQQGYVEVE